MAFMANETFARAPLMSKPDKKKIKRVVLAYSGGLDTSIILKWLQTTYNCEVVTFTADLGQGEELEPARKKAELLGVKSENIFIEDVREEFVRDFVFPMFRANAQYDIFELAFGLGKRLGETLENRLNPRRRLGPNARRLFFRPPRSGLSWQFCYPHSDLILALSRAAKVSPREKGMSCLLGR
jgi:hypothetical protein